MQILSGKARDCICLFFMGFIVIKLETQSPFVLHVVRFMLHTLNMADSLKVIPEHIH